VPAIRHVSHNRLTWAVCGWFLLAASPLAAQEPVQWKTGVAFRQQLNAPIGIDWQQRSLRDGLVRLSQAYGVAIFLDRRIDPGQAITLVFREQPMEAILKHVATEAHADLAILGPVVYLGPPDQANVLATLAALRRQDASRLPNEAKQNLLRVQPWQWDELAQPQQLLGELVQQANLRVENPELISLDLWPAVSLPPLAWTDRLTLVLAGFGLTFDIDSRGNSVRLVPQPVNVVLEKHYSRSGAVDLAAQLRRALPEAKIRVEQGQIVVAGRQEDHDKVERLLAGQSVRTSKASKIVGEKRYSLQVANEPAGKVVRKVAESLDKPPRYSPQVLEKLKQPVTFEVKEVTLNQLLVKTLAPLGLTYRLTDDALEIIDQN
jgi:hypothetical protein